MPGGKVYGLSGDSLHLGWLYRVDELSSGQFSDVGMTIPHIPEGRYSLSFFNTWKGQWYDTLLLAQTEEGVLNFTCPDFTGDIAFKLEYMGPVLTGRLPGDPGNPSIFPNPCHRLLYIENLTDAQSIRLINLTGQVLQKKTADTQDKISFDLSSCSSGIYFLEIEDMNGSLNTFKIIRSGT